MTADELPEGWKAVPLSDIVLPVPNIKPEDEPTKTFHYVDIASIDNEQFRITETKAIRGQDAPSRARRPVQVGDVLFSNVRTYLRNIAVVPDGILANVCSTGFTVLRPSKAVLPQFLFRYVLTRDFIDQVTPEQTGTHYPATSDRVVLGQPIPLPPLAEQRRIVAAVERILDKVTAARARLDRVPTTLKRFRQAVLAAACSGRLTAEWRTKANLESDGTAQLAMIRQSRCDRWKLANPKKEYVQPDGVGKANIQLPITWGVCRAEEVCEFITKGTTPPNDSMAATGDVPFIKVYNLGFDGRLHFEINPTFITVETHRAGSLARSRILPGDVLMNLVGPPLGKVAVVPNDYPEWNCNQAIAIYRPVDGLESQFLVLVLLMSGTLEGEIMLAKTTAGQHNLTLEMARNVQLPLPPLAEQQEIVRRVSALFARADAIEAKVTAARKRVDALTQAVLAKAFRGELVPTEAELARRENRPYEPASELLARIQATSTTPTLSKRSRKPQK